ncbi:MAG: diguanylate cyclase [Nostoc sp.]|uniref:diguanylate cyclase domain-containing protein n=1 Tax=Nostoc sp. TaxID=1180 RepID=UPI002FFB541C
MAIAARLAKQEAASQAQQNSALWDSLTHLPNKRYLIEQLNRFIQQTPINTTSQYALLFVGLDSFKEINDAFGQQRSLAANSYSCLSRLHQFPTDTLKVERSFISQIEADGQNAVIWSFLVTEPVPIHLPGINCVYGFLLLLTF